VTHDQRTKRFTLLACILGSAIVFLDGTVVNVALPALQRDLDASLAAQQWVVEAYLLTLSSLLLVGGSLDDLFERRTVFLWGVAGFGVTSLLCAIAPSVEVLIAARALQGIAGALLVPSTLALIIHTFPPEERGAAIGSWTAWTGMATVIGPLGGGLLIDSASWRWIFAINVIPVAITLWLIATHVPRAAERPAGGHVDFLGGALCALGFGGTIFALIEQPRMGWDDPIVVGTFLGGLACLVLFVLHERRSPAPMLPLSLFRERNFAVGNVTTLAMYAGLGGMLFLLGIYVQQVGNYSALEAGASFLPVTALMFALSKRFGALADRYGPRLFMTFGPIIAGAGMLLMLRVGPDADYLTELFPALFVFGIGLSLVVAPLTAAVLAAVDDAHSGIASGVNNAVSRVAGLLAIAVLGTFISAQFGSSLDEKLAGRPLDAAGRAAVETAKDRPLAVASPSDAPPAERQALEAASRDASVDAFHVGMGIAAIFTIGGGLVAAVGIVNPRRRIHAEQCPGGAICGAPESAGHMTPVPEPAGAGRA
jgi:EmrB/QacA subfamily drug resistance transporter